MYVSEPEALRPAKIDPRTRPCRNGSYSTPARCALAVLVTIVAPMSAPKIASANAMPRRDPPGCVGISAQYARVHDRPGEGRLNFSAECVCYSYALIRASRLQVMSAPASQSGLVGRAA